MRSKMFPSKKQNETKQNKKKNPQASSQDSITQINKIRNVRGEITVDSADTKDYKKIL